MLGADGKQQLDGLAERLHTDRGIELAVVTVDNVPGTPKITESCVHCNRKHSYTRHTSQLTRASDSSSSSSDSSSGFSGGSSDGGGAGSSW